ncbi:hypothetical protein ACP70R_017013 [Stipagrostis hirtigluma subsp. patula]
MAPSSHPKTAPPLFGGGLPAPDAADMSFLDDVHPEVTDALLGFVNDLLDPANAGLDDFLSPIPDDDVAGASLGPLPAFTAAGQHCAKKPRACDHDGVWRGPVGSSPGLHQWYGGGNQQVPAMPELATDFVVPLRSPLPPPPPPALPGLTTEFVVPLRAQAPPPPPPVLPEPVAFVRGADAKKAAGNGRPKSLESMVARERRKRISEKTAELSRLIPGGHKLNTAEMLQEAGRHIKLLQAQVAMLSLMHAVGSTEEKIPAMAQEQLHALIGSRRVQERLAAEGKCLVPMKLVDAMVKNEAVKSNVLVSRDLHLFMASLEE